MSTDTVKNILIIRKKNGFFLPRLPRIACNASAVAHSNPFQREVQA